MRATDSKLGGDEADAPEIEVSVQGDGAPGPEITRRPPAGTPPPRNPRQRRNPADDVIESGEIVERRSLVIRSSSQGEAPLRADDPTDISPLTFPEPPEQASRWHLRFLVAAVASGIAAIAVAVVDRPAAHDAPNLEAVTELIGTTLDAERQAALVRAEAVASSSMLRAGIETDAATLADMARDKDVVFPLGPGEVLEVIQVRDGRPALLLRLPANAGALDRPAAGQTGLALRDGALGVIANAAIAKQRSGVSGEIVLWVPVDLAAFESRLPDQVDGATIEGLASPVAIEALASPGGSANLRVAIATKQTTPAPLALAAYVPPVAGGARYTWVRNGSAVASGVLFALFGVFAIRARRRAA